MTRDGIGDMTFEETLRYRPFAVVSANFTQVSLPERAETTGADGLRRTDERPMAPFAAVELTVAPDRAGVVLAGLATSDGDHLLATYDLSMRRATVELRVSGSIRVLAVSSGCPLPARGFAFALCENQVTALVDSGDGWQPLVTTRRNVAVFVDFRDPSVLRRYTYAYGVRPASPVVDSALDSGRQASAADRIRRRLAGLRGWSGQALAPEGRGTSGHTATLSSVRAGVFGMAGVRDPHLVQLPDGTPYVRDGKLYLTLTCAGLGFFQQAHWGVFTLDLDDLSKLEQVAHLFFRRDGHVLGDHAGQIIVDGDKFIVAVSSWGDFAPGNIHVRHTVSDRDLLAGVHVLDTEPLRLPTDVGAWDPALTRIKDRWYVAFVESATQGQPFDFHPALAVGAPGARYDGPLELVGADTSRQQCEGPVIAKLGGEWRVLASDGDAREYPVYDLAMQQVDALAAPYGSNIPHPQVVTVPGPAGSGELLITFDGTQYAESVLGYGGHGDLVILEATTP